MNGPMKGFQKAVPLQDRLRQSNHEHAALDGQAAKLRRQGEKASESPQTEAASHNKMAVGIT